MTVDRSANGRNQQLEMILRKLFRDLEQNIKIYLPATAHLNLKKPQTVSHLFIKQCNADRGYKQLGGVEVINLELVQGVIYKIFVGIAAFCYFSFLHQYLPAFHHCYHIKKSFPPLLYFECLHQSLLGSFHSTEYIHLSRYSFLLYLANMCIR